MEKNLLSAESLRNAIEQGTFDDGTLAFVAPSTLRVHALYAAIELSRAPLDENVRYLDGSTVSAPLDIMRLARPAIDAMVEQMDPDAL